MWLSGTSKKSSNTYKKHTKKDFLACWMWWLAICVCKACLSGLECECTGKTDSHPGRRVSSHSCLGIWVCYKPFQTLKQMLSHLKDPVPDLQRRGVVYKVPCNSSYIGQTGRRLSQRLDEHRRAVRQADFNSSALVGHAWTCNHAIDWTDVKVLSNPRDYTTRMLEEAVFIHQTRDTLNRDCGTLPAEYENLFEKG